MDSANPFTYARTASSLPDGRGIDDNAAKCDQTSGGDRPQTASVVSFGTGGAKHGEVSRAAAAPTEDAEAAAAAVLTPLPTRRNAGAKRPKDRWGDSMTKVPQGLGYRWQLLGVLCIANNWYGLSLWRFNFEPAGSTTTTTSYVASST